MKTIRISDEMWSELRRRKYLDGHKDYDAVLRLVLAIEPSVKKPKAPAKSVEPAQSAKPIQPDPTKLAKAREALASKEAKPKMSEEQIKKMRALMPIGWEPD